MKFVKGISLFFVIPVLTLLLGFGVGYLFQRDYYLTENNNQIRQLHPLPMTGNEEIADKESEEAFSEPLLQVGGNDAIAALPSDLSTEEPESTPLETAEGFYLAIYQNRVVVLDCDKTRVYLETDITPEELSEDVRQRLLETIRVQNEEELYSYLESFSS